LDNAFLSSKHIVAVVSNTNRYILRKTLPKDLNSIYISRVTGKRLNSLWYSASNYQKNYAKNIYNFIENNYLSLDDIATYCVEYYIKNNDVWYLDHSDLKKLKKHSLSMSEKNYITQQNKFDLMVKEAGIQNVNTLFKTKENGHTLIYELYKSNHIDLVLFYRLIELTEVNENELNAKRLAKIIKQIKKGA
jgi:hypothetical protein